MTRFLKPALIIALILTLGLGSLMASGGIYDAYKQNFGDARWQTKLNQFIDACSASYNYLVNQIGLLNSLVTNWTLTENYPVVFTGALRVDADTLTVPGDQTAKITVGKLLWADCGPADCVKTSSVSSASYAGGLTTVNINNAILTANLRAVSVVMSRNGVFPSAIGWVFGTDYGSPSKAALDAALAVIGVDERSLSLGPGTWSIDADLTIPANVNLKAERGAILSIATTKTLTFNHDPDAGSYQIFSCVGTGSVKGLARAVPEWFGAKDDNSTNNYAYFQKTFDSVADFGVVELKGTGTYLWDGEVFITQPLTFKSNQSKVKLPDNSAQFNDYTNGYDRHQLSIRSSDVVIDGIYWDGNSRGNYKVVGGVTYYHYAVGGLWSAAQVLIGNYGPSWTVQDIKRVTVKNCTFYDSPYGSCSTYNQSFPSTGEACYYISIENNTFINGQGVNVDFCYTKNSVVKNNKFINPYDFSFQFYYGNYNCSFENNTIWFKSSEIDINKVDPINKLGSNMLWAGQIRVGKINTIPNIDCNVTNNMLFGAPITLTAGMNYSTIKDNHLYSSEQVGLWCVGITGEIGNSIIGNKIYHSDQPGLYLDSIDNPVLVDGNELYGCCTKLLSSTYGSREFNNQITIWNKKYILKNNIARKAGTTPLYGVALSNINGIGVTMLRNDFTGSGNTADVITTADFAAGVGEVPIEVNAISNIKVWEYSNDNFSSDNTIDFIPISTGGIMIARCNGEGGTWVINADGSTVLISGTTNAVATDIAGKFCVFNGGTKLNIRNRLGVIGKVTVVFWYN